MTRLRVRLALLAVATDGRRRKWRTTGRWRLALGVVFLGGALVDALAPLPLSSHLPWWCRP